MSVNFNAIPFVQARWYTRTNGRDVRKLVIHTMEAPEKGTTAISTANYFAHTDKKVSAHYCLDDRHIIQCLQTRDVAYCAPGANHDGVHLELAGFARQTAAEWADPFSEAMLDLAAELCGRILVPKFQLPVIFVSAAMMKARPGTRGITTHHEVSKAFKKSDHWDPGPHFPMAEFLNKVRAASLK